jgi:hypothetical protein
MNTEQLKQRLSFGFAGYGHHNVCILYRGKEYICKSSNTQATDRIKDDNEGINNDSYYKTKRQALMSLYNECKRANNLR